MAESDPTDETLLRYLDEQLPVDETADVERRLRGSEALRGRLAQLMQRRESGGHTVGEIWRRRRVSCPSRSELGSFLLGALDGEQMAYVEFHLDEVGCRPCAANLADLRAAQAGRDETTTRRRRYFESSAGGLPGAGD